MSFLNTDWHQTMRMTSEAIDNCLGEWLRIVPVSDFKPNHSPSYDEADAFIIRGVFRYRSEQIFNREALEKEKGAVVVESRKPIASFSRHELPFALQRGDRIERQCDGTRFEITAVEPDGVARMTVRLVQLGASTQ